LFFGFRIGGLIDLAHFGLGLTLCQFAFTLGDC
jgi:hypothetical protein